MQYLRVVDSVSLSSLHCAVSHIHRLDASTAEMLVQSGGHPHAVPLGVVDKLETRMFESTGTSAMPCRSAEAKGSVVLEDPAPAPPAREVLSFSLKANKPDAMEVSSSSALLEWTDLELPSALSNASISYDVEVHQVRDRSSASHLGGVTLLRQHHQEL